MASSDQLLEKEFTGSPQQISESDILKYSNLLQIAKGKVESLKGWKKKIAEETFLNVKHFEEALREALSYCSAVFTIFRDDEQFHHHAEQLASAIVDMRNFMGEEIMPLNKFHAFSRGTLEVRGQTLSSAQYYEEIPFYGPPRQPNVEDKGITKFYEWNLIDKPKANVLPSTQVKCIYYLEKGVLFQSYYVLGMSTQGMHATIKSFNGKIPSFFTLEEIIVKQLKGS